jgi:hypothetical protein
MPNMVPVARLLFINRSGKVLKKKFRGKAVIADAFPLRATRRGFDIKSNRRRNLCIRIASAVAPQFGVCSTIRW